MAKHIYGSKSTGRIVNVVSAPDAVGDDVVVWIVSDGTAANVGDVFDAKDPQIDAMDVPSFRSLFRLENYCRQLNRALRASSTAANNAATAAGLPTTANSPDLTLAQARDAFKALIP